MPRPNTNVYRVRDDCAVEIVTAKGDVFLIDAEDVAAAQRHCWSRHEHGYARAVTRDTRGRMKTIYLHRLICSTTDDHPHVDHINGRQFDCRRENLRACNRHENLRNQKRRVDNITGFKGVGFHKQSGKYRARVKAGDVILAGGLFPTAEEAAAAAHRRRSQLHGEFARHV